MPTFSQIAKTLKRLKKKRNVPVPALNKKPQRKAVCVKVFTTTPRKPNSAQRKVAKIRYKVVADGEADRVSKFTIAYIPGEGHNLKEYSAVWFRGGRTQDLPGLKYKLMRGKGDFEPLLKRKTARSKYGVKKR
jgi:small subunit ribosomal protein S12